MGRKKNSDASISSVKKIRPALSPEAKESQMVSFAVDLAEKQLIEGTASPSVIVHYLRLGTSKDRLEKEKLEMETQLLKAKAEALQSMKRMEELYVDAINAMKSYSGYGSDSDDSDL